MISSSNMNVRRAKGHGLRATLAVEIPELSQGWHIKLRPAAEAAPLREEATRSGWARGRLPVPERSVAVRLPGIGLLISKTLEGVPSYKFIDILEPPRIVRAVSTAIGMMQEVDTSGFPFVAPAWTTQQAMLEGVRRVAASKTRHRELHPDFAGRTVGELQEIVEVGPGDNEERLSHGDLCMPNVLLDRDGAVTGIVDLGGLHIGHPKLDLGIMSWTVRANMGDRWESELLNAHATDANDQGLLYSRLSYDLGLQRPDPWAWTQTHQMAEQRARLAAA